MDATSGSGSAPILGAIMAAQRRRRRVYQLVFVMTWLVLITGVVVLLTTRFDWQFYADWWWYMLRGAEATVLLTIFSITLACVLAVAGALGRLSTNPVVNGVASLYVSLIRGTPLLVQIFVWAYAVGELGLVLPLFVAGIVALGVNYGAYMTEIFRAGIQAVPSGQREAAQALGMPERLIMRRIVLPQAFRIVIPAIGNDFIAMIKDTSLVFAIGIQELLFRANSAGRQTVNIMESLLFAALVYWVLTLFFSYIQQRVERRMARSDR
ncbi:MAG: amino acid ABC transporter permease [Chloroflexota bacterium]